MFYLDPGIQDSPLFISTGNSKMCMSFLNPTEIPICFSLEIRDESGRDFRMIHPPLTKSQRSKSAEVVIILASATRHLKL